MLIAMTRAEPSGILTSVQRVLAALLLGLAAPVSSPAGGGPLNVLVVVNDQSAESQELGACYARLREIPERNICHVSLDPVEPNISWAAAQSRLLDPVREHLRREKLEAQIEYLVLCKDFPSRVEENESITSVLYYGYKDAPRISPPALPCSLPENTAHAYYSAERAFHRVKETEGLGCLSMLLTGFDMNDAKAIVDRSVAAEGSAPAGTFYLFKPGDTARNIRHQLFGVFQYNADLWPGFPAYELVYENSRVGLEDVMGYLDGMPNHREEFWTGNRFRPGALADHLTSHGGVLPEPPSGQDSMLKWIRAGATATYGTVAEPCSILAKFPEPMMYFWYARGFNAAESYAMSVAHPYQGLLVGDPLAAPYAVRPRAVIHSDGLTGDLSGVVTVRVDAVSAGPTMPCRRVDLFVDEVWTATLTNIAPAAWNVLEARIGEESFRYVVAAGDSLYDAVEGLTRAINRKSPHVKARAYGDRIVLGDARIGSDPAATRVEAATSTKLAGDLTVFGAALVPQLQPSPFRARKDFSIRGPPARGDRVLLALRRPGQVPDQFEWHVQEETSAEAVLRKVASTVNTHPELSGPAGIYLDDIRAQGGLAGAAWVARQPGPGGMRIAVELSIIPAEAGRGLDPAGSFSSSLSDNAGLLTPHGALRFWSGRERLTVEYALDTTGLTNGSHTLRAIVYDGTAVETQGHHQRIVIVRNVP